jgi:hypothetical protein
MSKVSILLHIECHRYISSYGKIISPMLSPFFDQYPIQVGTILKYRYSNLDQDARPTISSVVAYYSQEIRLEEVAGNYFLSQGFPRGAFPSCRSCNKKIKVQKIYNFRYDSFH